MTKPTSIALNRRTILAGAGAATAALAAPRLLRAQTKELVVGGAAGFAPWMNGTVSQAFEQKYKNKQYLSVVLMEAAAMILAVQEGLLEKLTADTVPNLAKLRPGTVHMDGM